MTKNDESSNVQFNLPKWNRNLNKNATTCQLKIIVVKLLGTTTTTKTKKPVQIMKKI